jgi:hypothetical protein
VPSFAMSCDKLIRPKYITYETRVAVNGTKSLTDRSFRSTDCRAISGKTASSMHIWVGLATYHSIIIGAKLNNNPAFCRHSRLKSMVSFFEGSSFCFCVEKLNSSLAHYLFYVNIFYAKYCCNFYNYT